jgi:hypothetical protein
VNVNLAPSISNIKFAFSRADHNEGDETTKNPNDTSNFLVANNKMYLLAIMHLGSSQIKVYKSKR